MNWGSSRRFSTAGTMNSLRTALTAAAFEQKRPSNHSADQERIAYLSKKIQTKDEVLAELMAEYVALKKTLGNFDRELGSHDTRDQIVDFVRRWSKKTEIGAGWFVIRPKDTDHSLVGHYFRPICSSPHATP